jgi:thiamine pyrophosphate-dependent acetolactate synthase large subunit-like protein
VAFTVADYILQRLTEQNMLFSSAALGHSVATAVGAAFGSSRRPLVICGDGGF